MTDIPKTLAECSQRVNAAFDTLKSADLTPDQKMALYDIVNAYLFACDGCTKLMKICKEFSQLCNESVKGKQD